MSAKRDGVDMSQHFLLSKHARSLSLARVARMSEEEAREAFKEIRWSETEGEPVCPRRGCIACYTTRRASFSNAKAVTINTASRQARSSPAASSRFRPTFSPSRSSSTRSRASPPWRFPAISTCNTRPPTSWPTKSARPCRRKSKP